MWLFALSSLPLAFGSWLLALAPWLSTSNVCSHACSPTQKANNQALSSFYDYDGGCQVLAKRSNASRWKCHPTRYPNPIPLPHFPRRFGFWGWGWFCCCFLLHDLRARWLLNHFRWFTPTIYSVTLPRP